MGTPPSADDEIVFAVALDLARRYDFETLDRRVEKLFTQGKEFLMNRFNLAMMVAVATSLFGAEPILAQPKAERLYYLEHKFSSKYVCTGAKDDGEVVHLWGPIPDGHEPRYRFKLVGSGEQDYHYLIHQHSGKYICTGETEDGAKIHLWGPIPEGHEDRYKFKLINAGDGHYYLLHKHSGKFVCTGSQEDGGEVHTWGPIPQGHEDRYRFRFSAAD